MTNLCSQSIDNTCQSMNKSGCEQETMEIYWNSVREKTNNHDLIDLVKKKKRKLEKDPQNFLPFYHWYSSIIIASRRQYHFGKSLKEAVSRWYEMMAKWKRNHCCQTYSQVNKSVRFAKSSFIICTLLYNYGIAVARYLLSKL